MQSMDQIFYYLYIFFLRFIFSLYFVNSMKSFIKINSPFRVGVRADQLGPAPARLQPGGLAEPAAAAVPAPNGMGGGE